MDAIYYFLLALQELYFCWEILHQIILNFFLLSRTWFYSPSSIYFLIIFWRRRCRRLECCALYSGWLFSVSVVIHQRCRRSEVIYYDIYSLSHSLCRMAGWLNRSSNEWGLSLTKREARNRQKNVINDSIKFLLHLPGTHFSLHLYRELWWKVLKLLFPTSVNFDTFNSHKMASFWFISWILLNL